MPMFANISISPALILKSLWKKRPGNFKMRNGCGTRWYYKDSGRLRNRSAGRTFDGIGKG